MPEKSDKEYWREWRQRTRSELSSGAPAAHVRYFAPKEIEAIALRIRRLVLRGKIVQLVPATGYLCMRALERFASQPPREQIVAIVCGSKSCSQRPTCISCIGKANAIMHLFENSSEEREFEARIRSLR